MQPRLDRILGDRAPQANEIGGMLDFAIDHVRMPKPPGATKLLIYFARRFSFPVADDIFDRIAFHGGNERVNVIWHDAPRM